MSVVDVGKRKSLKGVRLKLLRWLDQKLFQGSEVYLQMKKRKKFKRECVVKTKTKISNGCERPKPDKQKIV
ncbi:hypothetical protein FRX31_017469 [Thalictrum thalictroides]|uniref:Uncharacterized protein n=1 Tax=Thalictrum thalictroides TaxID=46969 RepID=A0A7J6W6E1_THATH|nr:hypothetical protein FRX31_017469 [Thalictrum thalictroides]